MQLFIVQQSFHSWINALDKIVILRESVWRSRRAIMLQLLNRWITRRFECQTDVPENFQMSRTRYSTKARNFPPFQARPQMGRIQETSAADPSSPFDGKKVHWTSGRHRWRLFEEVRLQFFQSHFWAVSTFLLEARARKLELILRVAWRKVRVIT